MRETVPVALDGERVDRLVAMLTSRTRAEVATMVNEGRVAVDGTVVTTRSRRVAAGEVVDVDVPAPVVAAQPVGDASVAVDVVHVDDHLVVVDKPAGLVVHPGAGNSEGTLVHGLLARFPDLAGVGGEAFRPGIVHRLDKGTSGLLVVARTPVAHAALVADLAARRVERRYVALTWGSFDADAGIVDAPVGRSQGDPTRMAVTAGGRAARTRYRVVRRFDRPGALTLVECTLETGRTHQIRVHLAAIGHPVVGDLRYGGSRSPVPSPRPFLHAARLGFTHPVTGEALSFESPLPADLTAVLDGLTAVGPTP